MDNYAFLEYLRGKGFYVADESHTNYTQTIFSFPSALNFEFIDAPSGEIEDGQYFLERTNNNRLMRLLRTCGYRIAVLESGFYYTDQIPADLRLTGSGVLNEFEALLLADTPYSVLAAALQLEPPASSYAAHRQTVLDGFSQLRNAAQIPGPKLFFAHLVMPHPPFVFDAQGRSRSTRRGHTPWAMATIMAGHWTSTARVTPGRCSSPTASWQAAIDALLASSPDPAGDHPAGRSRPGSRLDWDSPDSLLPVGALGDPQRLLPAPSGQAVLYPAISPVNSFRMVLNSVFGTRLAALPDRTYFTTHRRSARPSISPPAGISRQNCQP